jgi:flagellar biosynthesis chaperone FliJ
VNIAVEGSTQAQKAQREFLMRRNETQTLETLIRNKKAQMELEQNRRDQQRLDDWFAGKHSQDRRKRTKTGQS